MSYVLNLFGYLWNQIVSVFQGVWGWLVSGWGYLTSPQALPWFLLGLVTVVAVLIIAALVLHIFGVLRRALRAIWRGVGWVRRWIWWLIKLPFRALRWVIKKLYKLSKIIVKWTWKQVKGGLKRIWHLLGWSFKHHPWISTGLLLVGLMAANSAIPGYAASSERQTTQTTLTALLAIEIALGALKFLVGVVFGKKKKH